MRQALQEGLKEIKRQNGGGVKLLLKLAEMAKKHKIRGPRDLSVNHDYYLWGGKRRNLRIKP